MLLLGLNLKHKHVIMKPNCLHQKTCPTEKALNECAEIILMGDRWMWICCTKWWKVIMEKKIMST